MSMLGKCLWRQKESSLSDDDEETICVAWQSILGEIFNEDDALEVLDTSSALGGDAMVYVMPNGFLAEISFNGWAIFERNGKCEN